MGIRTDFKLAYQCGYDDALAKRVPDTTLAESFAAYYEHIVADNVRLLELCKAWRKFAYEIFDECFGEPEANDEFMALEGRMQKLRVEVDE